MIAEILLLSTLLPGLYHCAPDDNICDQQVRIYKTGDKLTAIKVEYVGMCGSMGPYLYPCHDNICEDMNARFVIHDESRYHWENLGHPYECEMTPKFSAELSE